MPVRSQHGVGPNALRMPVLPVRMPDLHAELLRGITESLDSAMYGPAASNPATDTLYYLRKGQ